MTRIQISLRALLIQKDVKLQTSRMNNIPCLRALLIQEDVKHEEPVLRDIESLRALLI